jgi:hypothetical protein
VVSFENLAASSFFTNPVDFNLLKTLLLELPSAADSGNSRLNRMTASHFAPIDPRSRANVGFGASRAVRAAQIEGPLWLESGRCAAESCVFDVVG